MYRKVGMMEQKEKTETMNDLQILLPQIQTTGDLSTMLLPDTDLYSYWNLYSNRILSLEGEIGDWDYSIVKSIINLNILDKKKPIIILINSCGGLVDISTAIVNAIRLSAAPIWTVNMGMAMSAACIVFLAGEKRFTTKDSWCMTHAGSGGINGNYAETKEAQKWWDAQVRTSGEYIVERTGMDPKIYNKNKNKDWYINTSQQLEYGFATDMIESINELLGGKRK